MTRKNKNLKKYIELKYNVKIKHIKINKSHYYIIYTSDFVTLHLFASLDIILDFLGENTI